MSNRICLFAVLLSCLLKVILCGKNTACGQRTVDHHCCRFPFHYKGRKYRSCTYHGDINNHFWCATGFNYSKNKTTGWGYCKLTDSQCFVKTTDEDCCIFPFTHRGKEYKNCAATDENPNGPYWCATQPVFDRTVNGSGWGFCAGTTCFTCRSTESWEHCNSIMVKKICPYKFEHCVTFSKEEMHSSQENTNSSNNAKIFAKDCSLDSKCSELRARCNKQTSVAELCSHECCHGHLCNVGCKANGHGQLALLFAVVLAINFSFRNIIS